MSQDTDAARPAPNAPAAPAFARAADTDPAALGWMQGAPPPRELQVRFDDLSHFAFPRTRWAFAHMRRLVPSSRVWRGPGPASELPRAERDDIDAVSFTPMGAAQPMSWLASLDANYTDAIMVLHQGRIVYERYRGVMAPHRTHMAMSVTKSYTGTLAAMLQHEGLIDEQRLVPHYVPELAGTAFADATVRQVMDMTTGLDYSENYADPAAQVWNHARAGGLFPKPPGYAGPDGFYGFLRTVRKAGEHGQAFAYKTVNTDVLAWIVRRVAGGELGELFSQRFWQPLGAEQDADFLSDAEGTEFAGGGLNPCLRDLARFGEAMRCEGAFNGRQVVPAAVVAAIRAGASTAHFAKAGYATLAGWSYRHQWWLSHNAHGAFSARGVHGQALYVDPAAAMVVARFGSHPLAANVNFDPTSLPAYHALALHLKRNP